MQIGYMRVSKADGSQVLDLQRDALLAAGVSTVTREVVNAARDCFVIGSSWGYQIAIKERD